MKHLHLESDQKLQDFDIDHHNWKEAIEVMNFRMKIKKNGHGSYYNELEDLIDDGDRCIECMYRIFGNLIDAAEYYLDATEFYYSIIPPIDIYHIHYET